MKRLIMATVCDECGELIQEKRQPNGNGYGTKCDICGKDLHWECRKVFHCDPNPISKNYASLQLCPKHYKMIHNTVNDFIKEMCNIHKILKEDRE